MFKKILILVDIIGSLSVLVVMLISKKLFSKPLKKKFL